MEYIFIIGKGNIISIEDLNSISYKYNYPIKDETMLINYITNGNKAEMKTLINDIFNRNLSDQFISIELGRCLYFKVNDEITAFFRESIQYLKGRHLVLPALYRLMDYLMMLYRTY